MISNTEKGKRFQFSAKGAVEQWVGLPFELEVKLPVGNPPKLHAFDLASLDRKYVGEAKAFSWTQSGNNPSAKITTLRESVQYLQHLPKEVKAFIVIKHSSYPRKKETLANYFVRMNHHLLGSIAILELNEEDGKVVAIHGALNNPR